MSSLHTANVYQEAQHAAGQVMHPCVEAIIHAGIAASGAFKVVCVPCDGILLEIDNTHLREQFAVL